MTVIDVHTHHTRRGYFHESWWRSLGHPVQQALRRRGRQVTLEEATEDFATRAEAFCGDTMIESMDMADIDRMVLMPLDFSPALPEPEIPIEQQNEETAELCARHRDRLIFFAGVNPLRGERALRLFARMVTEFGAQGLKLHPLAGFYPNQREVYPFYERCVQFDIPVLIHAGIDPPPIRNKYGQPINFDDVCTDFPDLRVMCAHMGGVWRDEAVTLSDYHPNLWLDVCGTESLQRRDPIGFYKRLRFDLDLLGPEKICFGSDYPYQGSARFLRRWVETFRSPPPEVAQAGITFSEDEVEGILHRNAETWLGAKVTKPVTTT